MHSYLGRLKDGYESNQIDPKVRRESFDDFLTMKTLGTKRVWSFGNALGANAGQICMGGHRSDLVRNLCVRLDLLRLVELDAVTDVLDCSKQEFVLEALSAAISKAFHSIEEHGLAHLFEQRFKERFEKAGFSFRPIAEGGAHEALHFDGEPVRNKEWERHKRVADGLKDLIAGEETSTAGE